MTNNPTIKRRFRVERHKRGRIVVAKPVCEHPVHAPVPRISRLMAMAIQLSQQISDGAIANQTELSRLGHVSRARSTQILNLLNLAPEIQEALLHLEGAPHGREPLSERSLRTLSAELNWQNQKKAWKVMRF